MKKIILIALLAILQTAQAEPPIKDIQFNIDQTDVPTLGRGYDSIGQNWAGICVQPDKESVPETPTGSLQMKLDASQDDASSSLGVSAGGRYRYGVVNMSASADFAQSAVKTGYSLNFMYKFNAKYSEQFAPMTHLAVAPEFASKVKDIGLFYGSCGDEYINSVKREASILVNLTVTFSSAEEAQSFKSQFELNSPTMGITAALSTAASKVSKRTTMRFYTVQLGGSPGYTGQAICPDKIVKAAQQAANAKNGKPAAPTNGDDTDGNYCSEPVVKCGLGQFPKCIEMLEQIVAYSANNFSHQVTQKNGKPQNFAVTGVHVQPYSKGGTFPIPPPPESVKLFTVELKNLSGDFERYFDSWMMASRVVHFGSPRTSPRESKALGLIDADMHKMVTHIALGIEQCFEEGYTKCHENSDEISAYLAKAMADMKTDVGGDTLKNVTDSDQNAPTLTTLNAAITALMAPETFAQYCDLGTGNFPAIQTTIDSMKKWATDTEIAAKRPPTFTTGDECANYEKYFSTVTALTLNNDGKSDSLYPVSSLEPFTVLTALTKLDLSGQNIGAIDALAKLPNLKELQLNRNLVTDLCPLANSKSLVRLGAANNQITSLDCLGTAPALGQIDARGNSPDLRCPLKDPTGCKTADYTKTVTTGDVATNCGVHVGSQSVDIGGGRVLAVGGATPADGLVTTADMTIYDASGCEPAPYRLVTPRANFTLTKLKDGRFLVAGGYTDTLEIIDPVSLQPKIVADRLSGPRSFHTATLLASGLVLIAGGYNQDSVTVNLRSPSIFTSFDVFDPTKEKIVLRGGALDVPRAEHTATLLPDGQSVLLVGGYQATRNIDTAVIVRADGSKPQSVNGRLGAGRFGHTAVDLGGGRVLIAGGFQTLAKDTNGRRTYYISGLDSLEIYDANARVPFRKVDDKLTIARGLMGAETLSDGRILLFGGNTEGHLFDVLAAYSNGKDDDKPKDGATSSTDHKLALATATDMIEIFDPANEGIYMVGKLAHPRSQIAYSPIGDDSFLVIGGMGSNDSLLSAELMVYRNFNRTAQK